jgi:hypothetical protein
VTDQPSNEVDLFREYLTKSWRQYVLGTPATTEQIAEFEKKYTVRLPDDIREFFLKINGVYEFSGIEALKDWCRFPEYEFYGPGWEKYLPKPPEAYYLIGHYDIGVWHWLIELNPDPLKPTPVTVVYDYSGIVAESFSDFLRKWRLDEPEKLCFP